jgi:hypothetical protein
MYAKFAAGIAKARLGKAMRKPAAILLMRSVFGVAKLV